MSGTRIKICGLTRMQDIEYVNEVLPDYIGLVFAKSRRQISPETAHQLRTFLDNRITAVGVFVNESIQVITNICNRRIIDIIQLHGDESEDYIRFLRRTWTHLRRLNNYPVTFYFWIHTLKSS